MRVAAVCLLVSLSGAARADDGVYSCGSLQNGYGPYDYRTDKDKLGIVEQFHLTPNVITLTAGESSGTVGGDLDYTLRAFPNHHIALGAMVRLGEREKLPKVRGARYSVECYFQRAMKFRDDDAVVRTLFAAYLSKHGKKQEALQQLKYAEGLEDENPNVSYNKGLIYFDLADYDNALLNAQIAYRQGFPLPGLREKLKKVGKWREPERE